MAEKKTFFATVHDNGKFGTNTSKRIAEQLLQWKGKRIVIEMHPQRKTRSVQQNRYYWAVIVAMLRDCILDMWGEEIGSEEAHEILKRECNYVEKVNESTGEIMKIPRTTSELKTIEFEEYQERCRKFIYNFFNAVVPLPNTQSELDYGDTD